MRLTPQLSVKTLGEGGLAVRPGGMGYWVFAKKIRRRWCHGPHTTISQNSRGGFAYKDRAWPRPCGLQFVAGALRGGSAAHDSGIFR